ncbi:Putative pentatricopeptide repeat-containing protein [Apostasia shenzhenica]|uniref:Pentatricopeptide repeat-containing protein n=1 Tax=Apostasia shenzhenica TaxID=1088818 RepID=A0A2I0A483_9ASPA|nr:Putative pentatricopeptide repeat-containing protein [Apostasia shenzhenica]
MAALPNPARHMPCSKKALPLFLPSLSLSSATLSSSPTPIEPSFLLRLCTVLYQQQHAPDPRLHSHLRRLALPSSPSFLHELLLQVCNHFPSSWRPAHRFHLFLSSPDSPLPTFSLSTVTANKLLDVYGKSRNVDLLSDHLRLMADSCLLSVSSLRIAARSLADAREISKCVNLFRLEPQFLSGPALNSVVHELCLRKHVDVASAVVSKLRDSIPPDGETYRLLIVSLCRSGDLVLAAKLWNRMVEEGLEPEVDAYEEMMITQFKLNRLEEAVKLFRSMKENRFRDLGLKSYRVMIEWMCKEGRIPHAYTVFGEMLKRGFPLDGATLGALIYGLMAKKRVREAYRIFDETEELDVSLCHGLIKGLLRLRRPAAATGVFREMVRRGVEPTMHTYVMLLQGHMGKRGRKGRDEAVNFERIFVGGMVKAGRTLEASKYAERTIHGAVEVKRFDYNKFLKLFSDEEGVVMFEEVGRRLKEAGMADLGDVFLVYGERMATRERRRRARWR